MEGFVGWAAIVVLSGVASFGCRNQSAPAVHAGVGPQEQVLPLTFGGFLKNGPEAEKVEGICNPDRTRSVLNCDVYNGLPGWTITEVTLRVAHYPYEGDDARDYEVPITIKPRTTEQVTVRLGLQLPPDSKWADGKVKAQTNWTWLPVGAKGYPTK